MYANQYSPRNYQDQRPMAIAVPPQCPFSVAQLQFLCNAMSEYFCNYCGRGNRAAAPNITSMNPFTSEQLHNLQKGIMGIYCSECKRGEKINEEIPIQQKQYYNSSFGSNSYRGAYRGYSNSYRGRGSYRGNGNIRNYERRQRSLSPQQLKRDKKYSSSPKTTTAQKKQKRSKSAEYSPSSRRSSSSDSSSSDSEESEK